MDFKSLLPILLAAIAGQEKAFATSELTLLLTNENARVNAGLTPEQINGVVSGIVQLAFAEQTALVNALTAKTKAA